MYYTYTCIMHMYVHAKKYVFVPNDVPAAHVKLQSHIGIEHIAY